MGAMDIPLVLQVGGAADQFSPDDPFLKAMDTASGCLVVKSLKSGLAFPVDPQSAARAAAAKMSAEPDFYSGVAAGIAWLRSAQLSHERSLKSGTEAA